MRVSEETLNRSWVGMGLWLSGLLVGAYHNTSRDIPLLSQSRQRKNVVLPWRGRWVSRGGV